MISEENDFDLKNYEESITIPSLCDCCAKDGAHLKCSACKGVYYCNRECQKEHWKAHKIQCKQFSSFFEEMKEKDKMLEAKEHKTYDENSPNACKICSEVIESDDQRRLLTCNHLFCVNCLCSFYDQMDKIETEHCPLCRKADIEPFLWNFAYTNANDFIFQSGLYPRNSSLSKHFISLAMKEYSRLKTLIAHLPSELAPLQYDVLYLRLLLAPSLSPSVLRRNAMEAIQFSEALLKREIKDISLKIEITKLSLTALYVRQEYDKMKEITQNFFVYLSEMESSSPMKKTDEKNEFREEHSMDPQHNAFLQQKRMKMILSSPKCQEDIHEISFLYLKMNYQMNHFSIVKELAKKSVERNRYDLKSSYYLAKVYYESQQWEDGIRTLKTAMRYSLPWKVKEVLSNDDDNIDDYDDEYNSTKEVENREKTVFELVEILYRELLKEGVFCSSHDFLKEEIEA
jgi:hypothetical protein